PLVDELVVNVGASEDATRSIVESLGGTPGFGSSDTIWDFEGPEPWMELSRPTNRALAECTGAWVVYLQADEVLHDRDYDRLRRSVGDAGTFYHPPWGKLRPWKRWLLVRTGCFILRPLYWGLRLRKLLGV
ncbi:MAG: hypothetical protein NZ742_01185, partial [Acidobacteria bacterium]|nr:hypothetical protein [Acidobacteriota bacterium]MDW7983474.1 hypothetical protein [Acidobacteriota bacterium]